MAAGRTTIATPPVELKYALILLVHLSFGCVNLEPRALNHDGGALDSRMRFDTISATPRAGDAGSGSISSRATAGVSGTSTASPAGGRGEGLVDAGISGNVALDANGAGGSTGNAPNTGGSGGSAGQMGTAGDTGAGGNGSATGGTAGQVGGGPGDSKGVSDAAARDSFAPENRCALCGIRTALVHRYSFNGTGNTVTDSVGTAHGTVVNTQLSGSGSLSLSGGQYVQLPSRILSTLTSATLEIWVTWNGGGNNQRILDFGSSGQVDNKIQATTTVMISPNSSPDQIPPRLRASYSKQVSHNGISADSNSTLPTGAMKHIVAVLDGQRRTISMYLDGVAKGQAGGIEALSLINDSNNWLGKSQYSEDPGFSGTYYEFRIYNAPLTTEQIQATHAAGPNASFNE